MNRKNTSIRNLLLPFFLLFCLVALGSWLFVPWLLAPQPAEIEAQSPSQAVAGLIPSTQPDHVFFSPRAHSRDSCNTCHDFSNEEYSRLFKLAERPMPDDAAKRIFYQTGAMNMRECLDCHSVPAHLNTTTASESCGTCHR